MTLNKPTRIVAKCTSLKKWCAYLQANCGLNWEQMESRFESLAASYAMENNIYAHIGKNKLIFLPIAYIAQAKQFEA